MDKAKEDMLMRASVLEELTTTKGWEFIKTYIAGRIQEFSNRAIVDGFKDMEEYMFYRGEVSGLRTLLIEIENNLLNLNKYREEQRSK